MYDGGVSAGGRRLVGLVRQSCADTYRTVEAFA